jgi:hypothetical protein
MKNNRLLAVTTAIVLTSSLVIPAVSVSAATNNTSAATLTTAGDASNASLPTPSLVSQGGSKTSIRGLFTVPESSLLGDAFRIFYAVNGGAPQPAGLAQRGAATQKTLSADDLTPGSTNTLTAWFAEADGSAESPRVSITRDTLPNPPSAPTSLTAVPSQTSVALSWGPPADSGGTNVDPATFSYQVSRADGGGIALVQGLSYTASGLAPGQSYSFEVQAQSPSGFGASASVATSTLPAGAPSAPNNLVATAGKTSVGLSWSAPANDGASPITKYTILTNGGKAQDITSANTTVSGLAKNTLYTFTVLATNAAGTGPGAVAVVTTTNDAPTPTPTPSPANGGAPVVQPDTGAPSTNVDGSPNTDNDEATIAQTSDARWAKGSVKAGKVFKLGTSARMVTNTGERLVFAIDKKTSGVKSAKIVKTKSGGIYVKVLLKASAKNSTKQSVRIAASAPAQPGYEAFVSEHSYKIVK